MESTGTAVPNLDRGNCSRGMPGLVPAYPEHTPHDHLVVLAAALVLVMLALLPASDL